MNIEKEKRAISYLQKFEPKEEPYYLCYSGGKDSDCIRILAQLANVKHEIHHNLTTVDSPETVRYVKSIPGVIIEKPALTMWELIVKKGYPPTRLTRYCCSELKEKGGKGRKKIVGVRWEESANRRKNNDIVKILGSPKKTEKALQDKEIDYRINQKGGIIMNQDNDEARRFVESCYRTNTVMVNPIVDWTEKDVWEFLNHYGCESNPLYREGCKRIGCIGCPMASNRKKELEKYPTYKRAYIRAFGKMIDKRRRDGKSCTGIYTSAEIMYKLWVGDDPYQLTLEETEEMMEELL